MRHVRTWVGSGTIGEPDLAAALLAPRFDGLFHEELLVAHLDRRFGIVHLSAIRGGNAVALPIGRAVRDAVGLGTAAMLIAHNHPCGDPTPSRADRLATLRLAEALRPVSVRLVDHLVFGRERWISFRQIGWL